MHFVPQDSTDAELLAERIAIRLQHANSGVVLTTIKVILYLMNYMSDESRIEGLCRKLSPPLGPLSRTWEEYRLINSNDSHASLLWL
jgi:vesicle coat complex subunit